MTDTLHILNDLDSVTVHTEKCEFQKDVMAGLSKVQKKINSKYFYDQRGCELFDQITRHPDYYLTRCELEILNAYKKQLSSMLSIEPFNLIELGPGEGLKTNILIEQFLRDSINFTYTPIDISAIYLKKIVDHLNKKLPQLKLTAINSDYFKGLEWLKVKSNQRNFVLFLGSSIGNLNPTATEEFLHHLWQVLNNKDMVFIGFDLRKDIDILMRAYNDSDGITRQFNLNLLRRMNEELEANFNLEKFIHYPTYNVQSGAMESYLVSLEPQSVHIKSLDRTFYFDTVEPIHVEYSYKYHLHHLETLARMTGFEVIRTFKDSKNYYVDSLWQVKK